MGFQYYYSFQDSLYLEFDKDVIKDCLKSIGGSELVEIKQEFYEHHIELIKRGEANVKSPGFTLYLKINDKGVIEQYASAIHDVENCHIDCGDLWVNEWKKRAENMPKHDRYDEVRVLKKHSANMPEENNNKPKSAVTCSIM